MNADENAECPRWVSDYVETPMHYAAGIAAMMEVLRKLDFEVVIAGIEPDYKSEIMRLSSLIK